MSALPKQDLTMGMRCDLSGSGRLWTHLGEWVFQLLLQVEVLESRLHLQALIQPEGAGYALSFDVLFGPRRTHPELFVDASEAAAWFETELCAWLMVHEAEGQLARQDSRWALYVAQEEACDE